MSFSHGEDCRWWQCLGPEAEFAKWSRHRSICISTNNPGVGYAVEFSDTLANGTWAVNASATTVVTNIDATFERVVVTDNATSANRRFVRTRVTVL